MPFADITPHECIFISQCIDALWQQINYKVLPIELTPASGYKKLFLAEADRVFAYGLEAVTNPQAEPHLIFRGTTYPAGQGFITTVNTDLEAFETAGKNFIKQVGQTLLTGLRNKQNNGATRPWLDRPRVLTNQPLINDNK